MLKTAFKKFEEILSARRLYPFKLFKVCLPQNLLSPCLNTLSHISLSLRLRSTGLVFIGVIFTLWEEGATVAVVGYISGDGVTSLASDLFLLCWSKLNLILYINWSWLWETNTGSFPNILAFPDLTCHFDNTEVFVFWVQFIKWQ